jgi:hypothetical protein
VTALTARRISARVKWVGLTADLRIAGILVTVF